MKKKSELKLLILVLGLIFAISIISNFNLSYEEAQKDSDDGMDTQYEIKLKSPKKSGAYTEPFIHIDDNWTDAIGKGWFSGDGSWGNPYVIENVTVVPGGAGSGILINNSKNEYFIIRNCTVYNAGQGIRLINTNNGTIINNNCSNNGNGIILYNNCKNNTISGNIANYNDGGGIGLDLNCDNNTISGNTACDNHFNGIVIKNSDNNTISGNTVSNIDTNYQNRGIYLRDGSDNNTILGNTVNKNFVEGIYLWISCNDNNISKNLIKDNEYYGIRIGSANCQNNLIYQNSLKGNGEWHAWDNGANNHWNYTEIGNYWDNHTTPDLDSDGIIDNPYTWIIGTANSKDSFPLAESPIHDGEKIHINDFAVSIRDWHNTVRLKAWCSGSGTYSDPYVIDGLEIDGAGSGTGILIEQSNAFFKIKNCKVYNCTDGIKLSQTDYGSLIDNYCFDNTKGIFLSNDCDNNTILDNNVYDNADSGIALVTNCKNNSISNNTVYGPLQDNGIHLSSNCDYNNITGNTIYNNTDYQIWLELYCHNNNISGNTVNFYGSNNRGIFLDDNCDNTQITENIIIGSFFGYGIYLDDDCENNIIFNNNITKPLTGTPLFAGIFLRVNCIDNIIANNTVTNIFLGIYIYQDSNENIIANNTLKNYLDDIYIDRSQNITISGNVMVGWGIELGGVSYLHYSSHKIYTNNTINGRIVYYYVEQNGLSDSNFLSAGQVILIGCNNSKISNLNLTRSCRGIFLYNSHDNIIINNTANGCGEGIRLETNCDYNIIFNNSANGCDQGITLETNCDYNNITENNVNNGLSYGIYLKSDCDYNNITGNTANNNSLYGIHLLTNCDYNNITENTAINNDYCGIYLKSDCDNNNITGNILSNNGYYVNILPDLTNGGLCLSSSDNNFIWNNSFLGNSANANDKGIINYWNISIIGNYWDNYSGVDADDDGIGDTPYNITGTAGSQDFLPIWWDAPVINISVPMMNQKFGSIAPTYNLSIVQGLGDYFWCELLGTGKIMNLTKLSGVANENISISLNQSLWSSLPYGIITIRFYCNDTRGYIGFVNLTVIKSKAPSDGVLPPPAGDDDDDDEEEDNFLLIVGVVSAISIIGVIVAISVILINKRLKLKRQT